MPEVVISFVDGEVVHAEMPEITFDLAILEAELRGVDPNAERALFPVSAIRQLLVGEPLPAPAPEVVEEWARAAFHFGAGAAGASGVPQRRALLSRMRRPPGST